VHTIESGNLGSPSSPRRHPDHPLGEAFAEASILARKDIFANRPGVCR
jgi:hypothetical protein